MFLVCWTWQTSVNSAKFIWQHMLLAVFSTMTKTFQKVVAKASKRRTNQTSLAHTTQRQRYEWYKALLVHHFQALAVCCSCYLYSQSLLSSHCVVCIVLLCFGVHRSIEACCNSGHGWGSTEGVPQCFDLACQDAHCSRPDLPKEFYYQDHQVWQGVLQTSLPVFSSLSLLRKVCAELM